MIRYLHAFQKLFVYAFLLAACGDDPAPTSAEPARDTATGDAGGSQQPNAPASAQDASAEAPLGACSIANTAAPIQGSAVTRAAPDATGGTLMDGLYALTSYVVYGSPAAIPLGAVQETLEVRNNGTAFSYISNITYPANTPSSGTWVTMGSTITGRATCGVGPGADSYSATPTVITLLSRSSQGTLLSTFTKVK